MMRVLWSASDPGGGNAIRPVVRALSRRGDVISGIAGKPARAMFEAEGFESLDGDTAPSVLETAKKFMPDVLLAGTSGGQTIDKALSRELSVSSVYVMDFWSNYATRFADLPSAICVVDERMRDEMKSEGFPPSILHVTGNPHFDHFADNVTAAHEDSELALFISQPIKASGLSCGFDEFDVLDSIVDVLPRTIRLSIRLHPRDDAKKYDRYLDERTSISIQTTLEEALSSAGIIIGMFSPVLMQAAAAGKMVISCAPSGAIDPFPVHVASLVPVARDREHLRRFLERPTRTGADFRALFPSGATERVLSILDALVA